MLYKELIELFDMLDSASASGSEVVESVFQTLFIPPVFRML